MLGFGRHRLTDSVVKAGCMPTQDSTSINIVSRGHASRTVLILDPEAIMNQNKPLCLCSDLTQIFSYSNKEILLTNTFQPTDIEFGCDVERIVSHEIVC